MATKETKKEKKEVLMDKDNPSLCEISGQIRLRVFEDFSVEKELPKWVRFKAEWGKLVKDIGIYDSTTESELENKVKNLKDKTEAEKAYNKANDAVCRILPPAPLTSSAESQAAAAQNKLATKTGELTAAMGDLQAACVALANDDDNSDSKAKKKRNAVIVGSAVTAVAGVALTWGVTRSILDAQVNSAEQAAVKEFMDSVGSKIRCYIGGDEVGMYGDVISTSME